MNTTALLAMFVAVVAVGHSLKCYQDCGKSTVDGKVTNQACDSTKEKDCSDGQICLSRKFSVEAGGVKTEGEAAYCSDKMTEDAYCNKWKESLTDAASKITCEAKFCETALCNNITQTSSHGFSAHISLLVLAAGALVLGLF